MNNVKLAAAHDKCTQEVFIPVGTFKLLYTGGLSDLCLSPHTHKHAHTHTHSRIQFYASLIQSIATTEGKFDSEIAKVDEELADLMDSTASQAATGMHSTKRERSIIDKG